MINWYQKLEREFIFELKRTKYVFQRLKTEEIINIWTNPLKCSCIRMDGCHLHAIDFSFKINPRWCLLGFNAESCMKQIVLGRYFKKKNGEQKWRFKMVQELHWIQPVLQKLTPLLWTAAVKDWVDVPVLCLNWAKIESENIKILK